MENLQLLIKNHLNYFDIKKLGFEKIIIDHNRSNYIQELNKIKENVPLELGMYIYTSANDHKVLYVGEGILQKRLIRHLQKIRDNHSQPSTRFYFFYALQMKMEVYFIKASNLNFDKEKMEHLESVYKFMLNPVYDQMYKKQELYAGCKINLDDWTNRYNI